MRNIAVWIVGISVLMLTACSDGNSNAPLDTNAHPDGWFITHGEVAKANEVANQVGPLELISHPQELLTRVVETVMTPSPAFANTYYEDCTSCHGADLMGSGDAVSCYSCHSYNSMPPFSVHPEEWDSAYVDHREYTRINGDESCTACHGEDLMGRETVPSCFAESTDTGGCHPNGPGQSPHSDDYRRGSVHGPDAKADLTACQPCHAEAGGPGTNPRFNVGIDGNGCEDCHGVNYAHPGNWAGPNRTFHYTAGNIQNACTLCHGVALDGAGGVGGSCLECHADGATFALDCTACHASPPQGEANTVSAYNTVVHGNVANVGSHDECVVCHGMRESDSGGGFMPTTNYALFDKTTDTNGDHWDGNIQMNLDTEYNVANFGCDNAGCHGNNSFFQLPNASGLPVSLQSFGSGGITNPHPPQYLDIHGTEAKADLTFCQRCHGEAGGPGSNPRFNIGILGDGCETCHGINYAHPQQWAGPNATFHYTAGNIEFACTLCHGVALDGIGGVGGSCLECHVDAVSFTLDCGSCHAYPPQGLPNTVSTYDPVAHGSVANVSLHDECVICHGMRESDSGGGFMPTTNYALFDKTSETNGDHWDGLMQMNSGTQYNVTNFGCDNAACHGNSSGFQLPNGAGLAVDLKDFGGGGSTVPHPTDGSFLASSNHGPAAKGLTVTFPNGLLDCQECHANPAAGVNPRFNVGITPNGCENCHAALTAHPADVPPDNFPWYNNSTYRHSDVNGFTTMCALCHGASLDGVGGVAGAGGCNDCHTQADPVANPTGCVSCHGNPPDGTVSPNQTGRHDEGRHSAGGDCSACHQGAGYETANHFDTNNDGADVQFSGGGTYDPAGGGFCTNVSCHSGTRGPWY